MDKIIFLLKLAQKHKYTSLDSISSFENIDRPVTFLLYDLECEFLFLNDVDLQLILEFKISFGKYHTVCPKNPLHPVYI